MLRCAMLVTLHGVGGGHVDVTVTLHTGLDATLCYAGDVARGGVRGKFPQKWQLLNWT